jgi:hypothetical protein
VTNCPTCGRQVPDVAIHNADMVSRRQKYGKLWDLAPAKLVQAGDRSTRSILADDEEDDD